MWNTALCCRITSYNVCYTKLLRKNDDEAYDEPEVFFEERADYEPEKDLYVSDEIPSYQQDVLNKPEGEEENKKQQYERPVRSHEKKMIES